MDPHTGELYLESEIESLDPKIKERLVDIEGKPKHIRRVQKAVKKYNKDKRRKKLAKASKRKNR